MSRGPEDAPGPAMGGSEWPARGSDGVPALDADGAPAPTSAKWVVAAQRGDGTSVWTLLADRYQEHLLLFARRQIGPALSGRVEPQDLVQEAWLRVLPRLHEFEYQGPGSFRGWVKTQIARVAKEMARKGGARRDAVLPMVDRGMDDPERRLGTASRTPSGLADRRERADRTWQALHDPRMPPLYRDVFVACAIEERPTEDVAREQGVKPDTVRQQLKRARALLRGILGSNQ